MWLKYRKTLLLAAVGAFIIKTLMPFPFLTVLSIFVFVVVLEHILLELEKDTATKRLMSRVKRMAVVLISYLALRIVIGNLFGIPLGESYSSLDGMGFLGLPAASQIPAAILFDITFLLPGGGLAYMLVMGKGGTRGIIYAMSCMLLFVVVFQMQQPQFTMSLTRNANASINHKASLWDLDALKKEVVTPYAWAYPKEISLFELYQEVLDEKKEFKGFKKVEKIGDKKVFKVLDGVGGFRLVDPKQKPRTYNSETFVEIRLPDEDGNFVNGKTYWAIASKLRLEKDKPQEEKKLKEETNNGWTKAYEKPFIGQGYGPGDVGRIPTLRSDLDVHYGQRVVITGSEFQEEFGGNWVTRKGGINFINTYQGPLDTYNYKAPLGETFLVQVFKK